MFRIALLWGLMVVVFSPALADTTWVAAGNVSGNWTTAGSPYMISAGHVTVAVDSTLNIGPGVTVFFAGQYKMIVNGLLRAIGTVTDSIYFTTDTVAYPNRWLGLRFLSADDSCRLDYCVIEHGRAAGSGDDRYGGGIECQDSRPAIFHCRIRYCYAQIDGGAIYCRTNAAPVLSQCELYNNRAQFEGGGGIMARSSTPQLFNCTIRDNSTPLNGGGLMFFSSQPIISNCVISNNAAAVGGGIYCDGTTTIASLTGCTITGNTATRGGGVAAVTSPMSLSRCLISGNSATNGGGVMDSTTGVQLINCVLINNTASGSGGGLYSVSGAQSGVRHCLFYGNSAVNGGNLYLDGSAANLENSIVSFAAQGEGLAVNASPALQINSCDFYGNAGGDFSGDIPPFVGVVDTVNLEGDPCDRFGNIFFDPLFVNAPGGNFHLLNQSSCISAARGSDITSDYEGNPRPNPDDTQPDMGAHESAAGGSLYACGELSGEIGPGDVAVACDISVEAADTLMIAPGTRFLFHGRYAFTIRGLLLAEGTQVDSIVFTRALADSNSDWRGLRFISCHDSTVLSYVTVEHARGEGFSAPDGNGGIYCENSYFRMDRSTVRNNTATYRGGGIACYANSTPDFSGCVVHANVVLAQFFAFGGGFYTSQSAPRLTLCEIDSNSASHRGGGIYVDSSSLVLDNCLIRNNTAADGGGLYAVSAAPGLGSCMIQGNSASASGGGVFLHSHAVLNDCRIQFNSAGENGGGVYCDFYDPVLNHCVLTGNDAGSGGGGFYCRTSAPQVKRCTLVANSAATGAQIYCYSTTALINSSILASSSTAAIYFQASNGAAVRYCDFSGNPNGHFGYFNNDPAQGPANLGVLNRVNVNGDSSDTYYNIFLNPLFVDLPNGDFHLQEGSPCIQAGDPALPLDPDGTIADIGAFYAGPPPGPPSPFDLLLPLPDDTISTLLAHFCWQRAVDPDAGDIVTYTLHFVTPDTVFTRFTDTDSCVTYLSASLPIEDSVQVAWWVEAHTLYPDTTIQSLSTRFFFWAPPIQSAEDRDLNLPHEFALYENYPNPFNAQTVIGFDVPRASFVKLEVYDVLGRNAATLVDGMTEVGHHQVVFDATSLGSGIYFTRLTAGESVLTRKIVLMK